MARDNGRTRQRRARRATIPWTDEIIEACFRWRDERLTFPEITLQIHRRFGLEISASCIRQCLHRNPRPSLVQGDRVENEAIGSMADDIEGMADDIGNMADDNIGMADDIEGMANDDIGDWMNVSNKDPTEGQGAAVAAGEGQEEEEGPDDDYAYLFEIHLLDPDPTPPPAEQTEDEMAVLGPPPPLSSSSSLSPTKGKPAGKLSRTPRKEVPNFKCFRNHPLADILSERELAARRRRQQEQQQQRRELRLRQRRESDRSRSLKASERYPTPPTPPALAPYSTPPSPPLLAPYRQEDSSPAASVRRGASSSAAASVRQSSPVSVNRQGTTSSPAVSVRFSPDESDRVRQAFLQGLTLGEICAVMSHRQAKSVRHHLRLLYDRGQLDGAAVDDDDVDVAEKVEEEKKGKEKESSQAAPQPRPRGRPKGSKNVKGTRGPAAKAPRRSKSRSQNQNQAQEQDQSQRQNESLGQDQTPNQNQSQNQSQVASETKPECTEPVPSASNNEAGREPAELFDLMIEPCFLRGPDSEQGPELTFPSWPNIDAWSPHPDPEGDDVASEGDPRARPGVSPRQLLKLPLRDAADLNACDNDWESFPHQSCSDGDGSGSAVVNVASTEKPSATEHQQAGLFSKDNNHDGVPASSDEMDDSDGKVVNEPSTPNGSTAANASIGRDNDDFSTHLAVPLTPLWDFE